MTKKQRLSVGTRVTGRCPLPCTVANACIALGEEGSGEGTLKPRRPPPQPSVCPGTTELRLCSVVNAGRSKDSATYGARGASPAAGEEFEGKPGLEGEGGGGGAPQADAANHGAEGERYDVAVSDEAPGSGDS